MASPTAATAYLDALRDHLGAAITREAAHVEAAADAIATSIAAGGVLHLFGTGHSQLVALELAERAAGLAAVRAIADPALSPVAGRRGADTERLPGYGRIVLDTEDLRTGEVLVVVSNSGINAVPVDVAHGAAERGLHVVAVTSLAHGAASPARHPSGKRLHEVAHTTIDTGSPAGDAAIALADGTPTGPLSTVLAAALLHAVASRAAELLLDRGERPPVLVSQNLADADVNAGLLARYADRTGRSR